MTREACRSFTSLSDVSVIYNTQTAKVPSVWVCAIGFTIPLTQLVMPPSCRQPCFFTNTSMTVRPINQCIDFTECVCLFGFICVFAQEQTQRTDTQHTVREVCCKPATSDLKSHIFSCCWPATCGVHRQHMRRDIMDAFRTALSSAVLGVLL